jgi:hypothetical protein
MNLYIPKQRTYKLELCLLAILTVLVQDVYFLLNGLNENAYYLHTWLDYQIPLVEWFAIPYVWYYVYLVGVLVWFAYHNTTAYYQLLFARMTGLLICFGIYAIFPTATIRPDVTGNGMLADVVRLIYMIDADYNCFPSTHCLDTFLTSIFLLKRERGWILRGIAGVSLVSIYLSTLFLKQHVIADMVSASLLGGILFLTFRNQTFTAFQKRLNVFMQ